ncbi:hypothetical protein ANN_25874 [Periplaneta americana]|uniref:Uncharacterized protein n=1 Tax=Periplaneta americana TaxID=6978 RepID=A0ABQ8S4T5_PERAM|nr:hypothetical protein ANN_25874 [Periplaneta americana]
MSPGSNTESYLAFAHIRLRENPGKNLNQAEPPHKCDKPRSTSKTAARKSRNTPAQRANQRNSGSEEDTDTNQTIQAMFSNILAELKDLKKQNTDFKAETRKDIADLREEIKGFDKRIEEKCNNLETRVRNLDNTMDERTTHIEKKLRSLEEAEERRQRRERRQNIIIKNKEIRPDNHEEMTNKVNEILAKVEFNKPYSKVMYICKDYSDRGLARVELASMEDKMTIMKNKHKLAGEECFIDDDMTLQERSIQTQLRNLATEERNKGNNVKVGYQKILINDRWIRWNELPQAKTRRNHGTCPNQKTRSGHNNKSASQEQALCNKQQLRTTKSANGISQHTSTDTTPTYHQTRIQNSHTKREHTQDRRKRRGAKLCSKKH